MADEENWFEDYAKGDDEAQVNEYDITASPNDFNVLTLFWLLRWTPIMRQPEPSFKV